MINAFSAVLIAVMLSAEMNPQTTVVLPTAMYFLLTLSPDSIFLIRVVGFSLNDSSDIQLSFICGSVIFNIRLPRSYWVLTPFQIAGRERN